MLELKKNKMAERRKSLTFLNVVVVNIVVVNFVLFVVFVDLLQGFVLNATNTKEEAKTKEEQILRNQRKTIQNTQLDSDDSSIELMRRMAKVEEGDLFLGKYGRVHQHDQDPSQDEEESVFAHDFARLHFTNPESHSREKRSLSTMESTDPQPLSQLYLDLSESRPSIVEEDAPLGGGFGGRGGGGRGGLGSGGSLLRSSSSLSDDLTGHLVTEVRSYDRTDAISVGLSASAASRGSSSSAAASVGAAVTHGSSTAEGSTPLRIDTDTIDYHDVVIDEATPTKEMEIMEAPVPEVQPAPKITIEDMDETLSQIKTSVAPPPPTPPTTPPPPHAKDFEGRKELRGSTPKQYTVKMKRDKVKEMMTHSWNNYVMYAWGDNELRPLTRQPHRASIYGSARLGSTIIDSLSTLYLMGMEEEFEKGRQWVAADFRLNYNAFVSVFETNIRILGGLLSAYAMSGYSIFKTKSVEVADKLLPAFDSPTGIPYGLVSLQSGGYHSWMWAQGKSILAEIGTLHLEFVYLSNITGKPIYAEKVNKIRNYLDKIRKPNGGLYPNYIDPQTGIWGSQAVSMGALGDSFYEYLLKSWIQTGGKDAQARRMYDDAVQRVSEVMFQRSQPSNLLYIAEFESHYLKHHMGHLACFSGGMFALGAAGSSDERKWRDAARDIAYTCKQSYNRTMTGIGPEGFDFSYSSEATASMYGSRYYALRPEVIETWFYLWRFTKNNVYRQWAWEFVQSLERHCRTPNGFSGLRDVYVPNPQKDNVQQSFFLAETLKYLYLIFSEDDALPLDQWVFNTEAHPLPILHDYPEEMLAARNNVDMGSPVISPLWINP